MSRTIRAGEQVVPFDPALRPHAGLTFIGRVESPWSAGNCPHNLQQARERGGKFAIAVDRDYRAGLQGLAAGDAVIVLYWLGDEQRDLIIQAPAHRPEPTGTFALRSPRRPNPIGLAAVRLLAVDAASGQLEIDAIDAFDGTPVLDIKPWLASIDIPPEPAA